MLQLAVPNKGALSEDAIELLRSCNYKCMRYGRELSLVDSVNEVEFIFLRPRDIAIYVGNGIIDLGITGRDLATDSRAEVTELMALDFGRSKFRYAVPAESLLNVEDFNNLRVATSYPEVVKLALAKRGINAKIVRLDGAVEISVKLGVADVIADVVESGRTLKEAGLVCVGEPILESEAILIGRNRDIADRPDVKRLLGRLKGILLARSYVMIEYDIPRDKSEAACMITPGIESPTISPLSNPDWVAVKAMILRKESDNIMDSLQEIGARGIILNDIRSCRI